MDRPTFLSLPDRTSKPRELGLTHVIDKGQTLSQIRERFDTCGEFVDIVKLGWGTSYVTQNLREKLDLYRDLGVPVVLGGTLLEAAIAQGKVDEYRTWITGLGLSHVEVSDGTIEIPHDEKLELIRLFARDFTVLSEVGSKDANTILAPYKWVEAVRTEIEAGAWKVITEARETGTAGIFRQNGEVRQGLVDELVDHIDPTRFLFEAPQKPQQVWFISQFGPNVNLGNIAPDEVIPLETLRLGLRSDTLGLRARMEVEGDEAAGGLWRTVQRAIPSDFAI